MTNLLPNLVIIGAQKCGTTTLHSVLDRHPLIEMTTPKEQEIFAWDDWEKRLDRLEGQYSVRSVIRGEGTPIYLHDPLCAERISSIDPEMRILCILRHPTARAYSHYWHNVKRGQETLSFPSALAIERERLGKDFESWRAYSYVTRGYYHHYLEPFKAKFGDRLMVIGMTDLLRDPANQLGRVLRFLELDSSDLADYTLPNDNAFKMPRSRRAAQAARQGKKWPVTRLPARILRGFNLKESSYPDMDPEIRRLLDLNYAPELRAVLDQFGLDLGAHGYGQPSEDSATTFAQYASGSWRS